LFAKFSLPFQTVKTIKFPQKFNHTGAWIKERCEINIISPVVPLFSFFFKRGICLIFLYFSLSYCKVILSWDDSPKYQMSTFCMTLIVFPILFAFLWRKLSIKFLHNSTKTLTNSEVIFWNLFQEHWCVFQTAAY
jgi:hypothetical protein